MDFVSYKGERSSKLAGSLEVALEAKDFIEKQIAYGQYRPQKREQPKPKDPPKPTISEYYATFKETYLKTAVMESTASSFDSDFKNHILPKLGDLALDQVTEKHMEEFIADLVVKKKLAKATIKRFSANSAACFPSHKHKLIAQIRGRR